MKRADEKLIELANRYFRACTDRDIDYIENNSIDDPENSYSGITTGTDGVYSLSGIIDHLRGLPKVGYMDLNPKGYVVGDFAWFTDAPGGIMPSGQQIEVRATLLMRRVGEEWKVVHFHVSEGVFREL